MRTILIIYTIFLISATFFVVQPKPSLAPVAQQTITTENSVPITSSNDVATSSLETQPLNPNETENVEKAPTPPTEKASTPKEPNPKTENVPTSPNLTIQNSTPTTPQINEVSQTPLNKTNELVRKAMVNILCRATNQTLTSLSGSGVIIDSRGIILTNAHIAQYFLLANYPNDGSLDCVIRTGSPAYPRYRAELIYISPSWIIKNSSVITSKNPTGTGERDFAFLRITEAIDKSPLPNQFDFLVMETKEPILNQNIVLSGYPAGFLGSISVERDLHVISAISKVFDIFTFSGSNTPDLISTGSTMLAQAGASGGAVASQDGTLLGIIVTTTEGDSTADRDLRAITTTHINRSFKAETNETIEKLLEGNIEQTAKNFEETVAPILREELIQKL